MKVRGMCGGIVAVLCVILVVPAEAKPSIRHYYIAAEYVTWNYAPSGRDLLQGMPIPAPWSKKLKWPKVRYLEYTDDTFTVRKPQPEWLGILGPIIRAEVGDRIVVDFLNRTRGTHGIHPHGLRYDKANEGASYIPSGVGAGVPPDGRFTYHWFANKASGPSRRDPSSVVWWYHPHTDEGLETNAGLLGPIIITAAGKARRDATPVDVDREFVALFMIFDEAGGKDEGLFHTINGYVFGNLPGLVTKKGERVRWYLLAMGNERDLHTPHWHGETVERRQSRTDVIELLPASMTSADMLADNPGTWLFHCQVADHMEAGMMARYTIVAPSSQSCPVKLGIGTFWQGLGSAPYIYGEPRFEVINQNHKTIHRVHFGAGYFLGSVENLNRVPYTWNWSAQIGPQGKETAELSKQSEQNQLPAYYTDDVIGLVVYPDRVEYSDGSVWTSRNAGECFATYWRRDTEQHRLIVLPPFQVSGKGEGEEEEE